MRYRYPHPKHIYRSSPILLGTLLPLSYQEIDQDGDGFITELEFRNYMEEKGETVTYQQVHAAMNDANLDRDGRISQDGRDQFMLVQLHSSGPSHNTCNHIPDECS